MNRSPLSASSHIPLHLSIDPPDLELYADPDLLQQAIINLVLNAADAVQSSQGPEIRIRVQMNARQQMVIQVEDHGIGMTPHGMKNVFTPFFTTKPSGSGIGLSLVRQIMRLHRGHVSIHSQPGQGTLVTLTF